MVISMNSKSSPFAVTFLETSAVGKENCVRLTEQRPLLTIVTRQVVCFLSKHKEHAIKCLKDQIGVQYTH